MQISEKHALVTGGAKRIGREIAETLAQKGARLSLHCNSSRNEAEQLAKELRKKGAKAHVIQADLREISQIEKAVGEAVKNSGPVDILINSASVFYPTPALDCTVEAWNDLININLRGQFFFAKYCAASMKASQKIGTIVQIADVDHPVKNHAAYLASKGGLLSLTRALALEWAPRIRVNSVCPGPVLFPENYSEEKKAGSIERTLLKRVGSPQDIAEACVFLIENDYLTGMELVVDGGRSLS